MSRQNAARRNRALRKIRSSRHVPPEIKLTIEAILDLLNRNTGYSLAWPSAATLAKLTGKSRRTILWHLKVIKKLGIFTVHSLSPDEAKAFARKKYGIEIKIERCRCRAPNLFEVNLEHPLWDESRTIPPEVDEEWKVIVERVSEQRNARSTSRFTAVQRGTPEPLPEESSRLNGCSRSIPFPDRMNGVARDSWQLPRMGFRE